MPTSAKVRRKSCWVCPGFDAEDVLAYIRDELDITL